MTSRERLESSDSMGEWSVIDSNDDSGHQPEETSEDGKQLNKKKSPSKDEAEQKKYEVLDDAATPDSTAVENISPTQGLNAAHFYKLNLDNLSKIWILIFVSLYIFSWFFDNKSVQIELSDNTAGQHIFSNMNPKQMHRFLSDDNDLCIRLIEDVKKIKTGPLLIMGKEGKKSQSVRALLNDLIVNSQKLTSSLAELKLEDFPPDEKTTLEPLLKQNVELRTEYYRRRYLEGDFESLKNSLNHWNDKYANLRSQAIHIYDQVNQEDANEEQISGKRDLKVVPKINEKLIKKAEVAVFEMMSEQVAKETKETKVQTDRPISETKKKSEHVDTKSVAVNEKQNEKVPDGSVNAGDDAEIETQMKIFQMLKELKDKFYVEKTDEPQAIEAESATNCENRGADSSHQLANWEVKLIKKVAKAYSAKFADKNKNWGDAKNKKKVKIQLEISERLGNELLKLHTRSVYSQTDRIFSDDTAKGMRKKNSDQNQHLFKSKLATEIRELSQTEQNANSNNVTKSRGSKASLKMKEKTRLKAKDIKDRAKKKNSAETKLKPRKANSDKGKSNSRHLKSKDNKSQDSASKEIRNVFKKKFSNKKQAKKDESVYYKGQHNKMYNKPHAESGFCKDHDCEDEDDDDNDVEEEKNGDELLQQPAAPYLRRGRTAHKEQPAAGVKKHWHTSDITPKRLRQPSANPKAQFIPRTS